ncbi:ZYRO0B05038p [Zygosaccharomyces rouxii]|uniref:ZYRO0B05038p n=1 Tax=Zygosaccharomyces rouxii (strain ATCC 2623 / CBS 732 / NBRC 1130 / NCYC 568 / NRRL Y-229) TaxID=559307 RepID=C5DR26_ZYGRC|nr:uncharacterized protein ZYRO0B05038g [Zygosaccharomyces rouxii]KAH9200217.1 G protein-coupled glucose receptor regulating Gpa2-domain-containing protein [Zygosaccharomyces rouxii]CAR26237.1 ZYRO0B05038p [Zygosaccharomyces rouxii]
MSNLVKELSHTTRPPLPTNNPHDLPLPHQLLHHNTTAANQVLGLPGMFSTFNAGQLKRLRTVAITSSALSLAFGVVAVFCLINIDKRRKVFRHDLLFFLIVCGFIKALVLMIYPMVILIRDSVYFNPYFFNILGWFTAYTVEGSDLAIFFFAVHFGLLIFRPSRKWRNRRTGNLEGGLYRMRALIWPLTGSIPLLLASLAFVDFTIIDEKKLLEETTLVLYNQRYESKNYARIGGYKPYSAWCYLPPYPLWYKLVLSWGPRYFLIIFILTLYAAIYAFVVKESRKIKRELGDFRRNNDGDEDRGRKKSVKSRSLRFSRFFTKPIAALMRAIKSFCISTDDISEQERDVSGAGTQEHGMFLSFFNGMNEANGRGGHDHNKHTGNNDGYHNDNNNTNTNNHNYNQNNIIGAGLGNDSGRVTRQMMGNPHQLHIDSVIQEGCENLDEEEGNSQVSEDLFGALSNPSGLHNENEAPPSPEEDDHRLKPSNSKMGVSPIHSIFRPLGGKKNHPEKSNAHTDQKKERVNDVQADFQRHTYAEMKRRRLQIQRNVKLIFVYPFSYIAIWIFPLVVDITQYRYEITHGPIVWLAYIATIVQPLNCFVDTIVFLFRERPWKYSWREVETKELMDAYMLKGELNESDIAELCSSELGRRGWYFRGRLERKDCWRHQPARWKRIAWYLYRFFKGTFKKDYDFKDNCNDENYWNQYYSANTKSRSGTTQKHPSLQKERQFSFPSDSTTLSDAAAQHNNVNKRLSVPNESEYTKVPLFWKAIHFLPMLRAIDLDEVNRQIRLKSKDDDFVIPGLQAVLGASHDNDNKNNIDTRRASVADGGTGIFKPGYSLSATRSEDIGGLPTRWEPSAENPHINTNASATDGEGRSRNGTSVPTAVNMDFSDVVGEGPHGPASKKLSLATVTQDDAIDMLAFLKGPTT